MRDNMLVSPLDRYMVMKEALKTIASKSSCECFEPYPEYHWVGCPIHHSDDEEEWCICCIAHEALKKIGG
jgi:hypothetical protein